MIPKFKIENDERLHITDKYLCNGHWLIKREFAKLPTSPKVFNKILLIKCGSYRDGIKNGLSDENLPDMESIIPKRDDYEPLEIDPCGVTFRNGAEIFTYNYKSKSGKFNINIQPQYVPLLNMGRTFMKTPKGSTHYPILILNGDSINDDLIGIVMPCRA